MDLKLFSDLIDALGKVVDGLKAIVSLPKNERKKYRQTVDEIFRLIDTTLNMVIIRLGDILLLEEDDKFLDEVRMLDNYDEWVKAERDFRLCKSLRVAYSEASTLSGRLAGVLSVSDWETLLEQMHSTFVTEGEVADYIVQGFDALASSARSASKAALNAQTTGTIREQVAAFKEALIKERQQLIQQEIALYTIV